MVNNLLSVGLVLAWLVTPESLVLISKAIGLAGEASVVILLTAVAFCGAVSFCIHNRYLKTRGCGTDLELLRVFFGHIGSLTIVLGGRMPVLFYASTGMLVSAGYAFNEIYLYWFPNFLFASLMLFIVVCINLAGETLALRCQVVFVVFAVAGLAAVLALTTMVPQTVAPEVVSGEQSAYMYSLSLAVLVYLGFDFPQSSGRSLSVYLGLGLGASLLVCWSYQLQKYVAPVQLAESAVSYMLLARKAGGDIGRGIMGVAVLSGVAAGVNGLFIISRRAFAEAAAWKSALPAKKLEWVPVVFFGIVIEVMMISGVAGENLLETQVRGALALWLFYLGIRVVIAGRILDGIGALYKIMATAIGLSVWVIMIYLISMDLEKRYIITFMLSAYIASLLVSWVFVRLIHLYAVKK